MARASLVLNTPEVRATAKRWIDGARDGTRLDFKDPKRTLPQNNRLWAMLTDVARQKEHMGRKYSTHEWKALFMHALGRETEFLPALDGHGFFPFGQSTSDLSKAEMADLIEFMHAWGAEHGVEFHDNDADRRASLDALVAHHAARPRKGAATAGEPEGGE